MKILVCVKQVPDTTEIKIDPVTNTLIRAGVPSIVNPFDAYALEIAARIKDENPDTEITLLSMGPDQAKNALRECLAVGGDKAYLCSDRKFGGSDTLATSYILASAIEAIEAKEGKFDIIFGGKQAIDGDTGQVGPEIAAHMGLAQVTYASEVSVDGDSIIVKRESDQGYDMISVQKPAVVTVVKTAFEPRYPTIKSKMAARKKEITVITADDMPEIDLTRCGLKGSPTKVKKTFTPVRNKTCVKIAEEAVTDSAIKLVGLLADAKVL
ncbi:MAG: electron transfer flavoprotein subunit beta/FixA family protein [Hespellia sp.]|nr:electron transfer flavoprotein subunit beta/FixA family protein [Hespellia sp.]